MLELYGFKKLDTKRAPRVVVGLSCGVDSSATAAVLKWQGYNVIGLFMKNWEETTDTGFCTSERDYEDVKRVADAIGIPYYAVNFSKQYYEYVFEEFLRGLKNGYTPNPDILCNREIKFGPFLEYAKKLGADFVATGHYARIERVKQGEHFRLLKGVDTHKDQSYFLCGLSADQLRYAMFPIGHLEKKTVREIAKAMGLVVAEKKDSTGICFIGERKFRDFMKTYFGNQAGEIRTLDEKVVGTHIGLMYYTLGQRKGLGLGGSKDGEGRWFVVKKDLSANVLYVSLGDCDEMYTTQLVAREFNWINPETVGAIKCRPLGAKHRYNQPDQKCTIQIQGNGDVKLVFDQPQRAVTPGQWVVLYDGDICLGGGAILG